MSDAPGGRGFSEEEVALIIKRAAELQQTEQVEQEPGHAMTLAEVEQIASEAGIDPRLIRRAAQTLDRPAESNRPSPWLGAPTRIAFERVVDGEMTADAHESIVNELRRTFGENGAPSVLGRTLAWTSTRVAGRRQSRGRQIDASVISRGGVTTIRLEEELGNVAAPLFAGLMAGGAGGTTGLTIGVAMTVFQSAPIAAALWVAVAGGFYTLSRAIYGSIAAKREDQLRQVTSRLEEMVRDAIAQAPAGRLPGSPGQSQISPETFKASGELTAE